MNNLRIVSISDVHSRHNKLTLPEGDVLICSGDATMGGKLHEVQEFAEWFGKQNFNHKILVAGNHDFLFEEQPQVAQKICFDNNITYLEGNDVIIEGIKFYGDPWTKWFFDWAFNLPRYDMLKVKEHWAKIPDDTNVLILHGPAWGILDKIPSGHNVGCEFLSARINKLKDLKLFQFGHIHRSYGIKDCGDFIAANASICNEQYNPVNIPLVFDIDTKTKKIEWGI